MQYYQVIQNMRILYDNTSRGSWRPEDIAHARNIANDIVSAENEVQSPTIDVLEDEKAALNGEMAVLRGERDAQDREMAVPRGEMAVLRREMAAMNLELAVLKAEKLFPNNLNPSAAETEELNWIASIVMGSEDWARFANPEYNPTDEEVAAVCEGWADEVDKAWPAFEASRANKCCCRPRTSSRQRP